MKFEELLQETLENVIKPETIIEMEDEGDVDLTEEVDIDDSLSDDELLLDTVLNEATEEEFQQFLAEMDDSLGEEEEEVITEAGKKFIDQKASYHKYKQVTAPLSPSDPYHPDYKTTSVPKQKTRKLTAKDQKHMEIYAKMRMQGKPMNVESFQKLAGISSYAVAMKRFSHAKINYEANKEDFF